MTTGLHLGVFGAGSIGAFIGARLVSSGARVTFVGRPRFVDAVRAHGLSHQELDDEPVRIDAADVNATTDVGALSSCDVVMVAVKSADTESAAEALAGVLDDGALVVSLQNGVGNVPVLRRVLAPRTVLGAIVDFNVVSREGALYHRANAVYHRALTGPLVVEVVTHAHTNAVVTAFTRALHVVKTRSDIAPDQWTKLLVNLNNAVSALTDLPSQALLLDPKIRRVMAAIVEEAISVVTASGQRLAPLRGLPAWVMPKVLRLPTPVVKLITRRQFKMNAEARSSMWEDLNRRRPTEVDALNGEIVRLAHALGRRAPVNIAIVDAVKAAEAAGEGPPGLDGEALLRVIQ